MSMFHLIILLALFSMLTTCLLWSTSPLGFAMLILMMAGTASLITGLTASSLMALMLFLTYIGGIMVLFAYVIASSNMNVTGEFQYKTPLGLILLSSLPSLPHIAPLQTPHEVSPHEYVEALTLETHLIGGVIILLLLLLFTMLVVAKVAPTTSAPMRPFK